MAGVRRRRAGGDGNLPDGRRRRRLGRAEGIVHSNTFGVRDLASGAPVTAETHFFVASTTKSMTSLLVATLVDDGALAWDQPVREAWPDFRAPTDALTQELRVRDLFGMASGIAEPPALSAFHEGDPTAIELLQSLAVLPVTNPPNTVFFYNNTVYAVGGYLPPLLQQAAPDDLETVYAHLMTERVYRPAGMTAARITDDPRPFVADYATGHAPDFVLGTAAEPFAPVGSYAPVGGTLATLGDMASYVAMQLRRGVAVDGTRVVSAANLAECWNPRIDVPVSPAFDPDAVERRIRHGLDLRELQGRAPARLAQRRHRRVLRSHRLSPGGEHRHCHPDQHRAAAARAVLRPIRRESAPGGPVRPQPGGQRRHRRPVPGRRAGVGAASRAGAPGRSGGDRPYLGHYEKGWSLAFDAEGALRLRQSSRAIRIMAMDDGSYVMAGGVLPGQAIRLSRDGAGMPRLAIQDVETVRWTGGPASWDVPAGGSAATPTP